MPGIFENTNENLPPTHLPNNLPVTSNQGGQLANDDHSSHNAIQEPIAVDETTTSPVRELTQTDKINRYMLKSFLEHMNQQLPNQQITPESDTVVGNVEAAEEDEW